MNQYGHYQQQQPHPYPGHLSVGGWSHTTGEPGFGGGPGSDAASSVAAHKDLHTRSLSPPLSEHQGQSPQQPDLPHFMPGVYLSELQAPDHNEASH